MLPSLNFIALKSTLPPLHALQAAQPIAAPGPKKAAPFDTLDFFQTLPLELVVATQLDDTSVYDVYKQFLRYCSANKTLCSLDTWKVFLKSKLDIDYNDVTFWSESTKLIVMQHMERMARLAKLHLSLDQRCTLLKEYSGCV